MNTTIRPDILTVSGNYFDFLHPENSSFSIDDIAHALSHVCRLAGPTTQLYSVARPSGRGPGLVPDGDAMAGLLHDAAEAFIGDVSRPLKQLLPDYKAVEKRVEQAVFSRFGISEIPQSVKRADIIMLATEQRDLMAPHDDEWALTANVQPLSNAILPLSPSQARAVFLERFYQIAISGATAHSPQPSGD